ncbi:hypothetical protein [Phenylobacterium conjunctum]|uniref:Uncharacterized protein n=1 Tax=Phenylobacterium conjunctum TaxID=1298959 RepID=A0ABW3T5N1_9CAUL
MKSSKEIRAKVLIAAAVASLGFAFASDASAQTRQAPPGVPRPPRPDRERTAPRPSDEETSPPRNGLNLTKVANTSTITTADQVNTPEELAAALAGAATKNEMVRLLNLAAQAGLSKASVKTALEWAKDVPGATSVATITQIQTAVNSNTAADGQTVTFFTASTATGSTQSLGNNALNQGVTNQPGDNNQTTNNTTSIYVG